MKAMPLATVEAAISVPALVPSSRRKAAAAAMQQIMIRSGKLESSSIFYESNAEFRGNAFSLAEEEAVVEEDFFDLDDDDIVREEAMEAFYDMKYGNANDEMAAEDLSDLNDIAVVEAIEGFSDAGENILRYDILREEANEGFSDVGENILRDDILGEKAEEGCSGENILGEKGKEGENNLREKVKEGENILGEKVKEGENILREKVKGGLSGENILGEKVKKGFSGENILREMVKEGENILREKAKGGLTGENTSGEKVKEGFTGDNILREMVKELENILGETVKEEFYDGKNILREKAEGGISDVDNNILREMATEGFSDVADDNILTESDNNIVRAEAEVEAEDSSNLNLNSSSKSAMELGFSKCIWLACQISSAAVPLLLAVTLIRRLMAWKLGWWYGCRRGAGVSCSTWELALWLGFDAGFISVVVVMASLVPFMIMTWTTALVFRVAFERHRLCGAESVICEGKRLAREIYFSTFHDVLRGGKILAALTAIVCLVILNLFRGIG